MVFKVHNCGIVRRVWAVADPPAAAAEPSKKKGGRLGLVPAKRKLVKTMAFLSIAKFVGSIFCASASGTTQTNSADSTSKIPSVRNSKQTVPEPDGLTFSQKA